MKERSAGRRRARTSLAASGLTLSLERALGGDRCNAILQTADELDATAIIVGSCGLTGVKSLSLGSGSYGLIQHADRAVIVVRSAEVAAARASRS